MVAEFSAVGCGGPQPSEFVSTTLQFGSDSRSVTPG